MPQKKGWNRNILFCVAVPSEYINRKQAADMFRKLVYVAGKPFWFMPEGGFETVEVRNGRIVDPVVFRGMDGRMHPGSREAAVE